MNSIETVFGQNLGVTENKSKAKLTGHASQDRLKAERDRNIFRINYSVKTD